MKVVVVGSVNADLVVRVKSLPAAGETVSGGTFERHAGGKSANQAVAAARLGARVAFVGAVGDDDLGAEAVGHLGAEGIDCSGVTRLADAPTGVALIVVDEAGENQIAVASGANSRLDAEMVRRAASFRIEGAEGAARAASSRARGAPRADAAAAGCAPGADAGAAVVLLGLEVPDEAVLAGARAAADARIVLNPAPARPLPDELLDLGPILTPNEEEAKALTGERHAAAAGRALAARTGAPAVITVGARGALLVAPGEEPVPIPALRVEVVDTTGAGDTFSGALAAQLAAGADPLTAARFATAAAALSTTKPGARGGMPDRAAVEAALAAP